MTKQNATNKIRIYGKTHKKLKIMCAKLGLTFAEIIELYARRNPRDN